VTHRHHQVPTKARLLILLPGSAAATQKLRAAARSDSAKDLERSRAKHGIKAFARNSVWLGHLTDDDRLTELLKRSVATTSQSGELAAAMNPLANAIQASTSS
jgi:hypothetical protein